MGGSQLTQLKSALASAGLNRKTVSKKDKKAWKKGGARESDRGKTLAKLEDIRKSLNKFDERETRVKHDVGGRNLKGVTGRPSASKQAGLEQRRKSLLPEHQLKGHTGTFRDRRFGESDPNMSLEDRMLERYTRERQRGQGRKGMFNLEDEEDGLDGFDEGTALGGLTHGGRSVSDLPGDDFMLQGLGDDDDEEDEDVKRGRIDRGAVGRGHFGGFEEEEEEDLPEKKKSKAEVMSEIIAKSKEHKLERQKQKEMDDDLRDALDEDLDDLRELLATGPMPDRNAARSALPGPSRPAPREASRGQDADYDQLVRTLGYEARAKPKDRTKTEDEMALEEAERLQKAEAKRQRRMRGEDASGDEDEAEGGYKKRRRLERRGEADDLDDDFVEDEELLGPGLTREGIEKMALPVNGRENDDADDDDDEFEEGEDGEDDEDEDDDEEDEDEDDFSEMEELNDDEAPELVPADSDVEGTVVKKTKGKSKAAIKEIPYTFPCPATIEEFEDILDSLDESALPTVVQRIRAVHHPSLAQGNKEKLQDFLGVLLDYILILASQPDPAFDLISAVTPHLVALVKLNPITAASHFISKITLMQKNLSRGLARGANRLESKTLPRCPELVLLRLVGTIWSTSDYSNPVVAPAVLLMGQYLAQSRIRSTADIASGLFLCSTLAQYESLSKRLLPEAVNFVASSLLVLLPRRKDAKSVAFPDIKAPDVDLRLAPGSTLSPQEPINLSESLGEETEQIKVDLVAVALRLVPTYAAMYASHEAFIETVQPLLTVLEGSRLPKAPELLKTNHAKATETLTRMLRLASASRTPLAMQAHKPIPIATYAPRFEDDFAPGRHYDPDAERNASNKLKALYKKERKGAIRELRKDNRFLAGEKAREQAEKDAAYNAKMRRVEGEIHVERAEEKEMQREKARDKRRAGRK